jgi:hypothetical protein
MVRFLVIFCGCCCFQPPKFWLHPRRLYDPPCRHVGLIWILLEYPLSNYEITHGAALLVVCLFHRCRFCHIHKDCYRHTVPLLRISFWPSSREWIPKMMTIIVPVHNKGDKTDCNNYRWISMLNQYINEIIGDHQCGFQLNRSATDQILRIRQILEKKRDCNGKVHQLFIESLWFSE